MDLVSPAVAVAETGMETQGEGKKRRVGAVLNGPCFLKILVANQYAGQLIGKAGQVVAEIEGQTGATLRLSPTNSFFPGTMDRIAVASGEMEQINGVFRLIMEKLRSAQEEDNPAATSSAQIVVPKSSVSRIIGKGGAQIRELQQQTQAHMRISNREEGLTERVVQISGDKEKVIDAGLKVIAVIQEDENLATHTHLRYSVATSGAYGAGGGVLGGHHMSPGGVQAPYGGFQMAPQPHLGALTALYGVPGLSDDFLGSYCDISFQLADHFVGSLIGKGGQGLAEVCQATGAKVQVSNKGAYVPGTQNRTVNVTGPVLSVHKAHLILMQKIFELENQTRGNVNMLGGAAVSGPIQEGGGEARGAQGYMSMGAAPQTAPRMHPHAAAPYAAAPQQPPPTAGGAYAYHQAPQAMQQQAAPGASAGAFAHAGVTNAGGAVGGRGSVPGGYDWHPFQQQQQAHYGGLRQ
uniref:K Homology domain-containing protein n=1 Tax=Chromera velia CCMP2878 TaxID=1169474 RepID=A0A0G4HSA1_9ALVE|eukprot:Cvel_30997.t1-p1 / transcript=Cvel_30997.t1 / gene=Cvel_30997 / organism=Chromera_velia_CCMP2878 / gene_product=RNA-binding protein Nova-2, putative / transcript_product=RNA-binding protein Nova-2, putative / location=Cvel_scaffold4531:1037-2547(+) / protein_length=463 / sequence_SO=supercontig / SO=protein_coding / is_pseudo=false